MASPFMPLIDPPYTPYSDLGQFFIDFDYLNLTVPIRVYSLGKFANAEGDNLKVKVAPDLYSIRWTYDFDKQSASVPEGGSAALVAMMSLGTIAFFRTLYSH